MGFEKEGSKNGVGGFFHLFDWTAKSRKKLFSNKLDLPEQSKQVKKSDGNLPTTRLSLLDEDETGAGTSFKASSDYSCASSVTDEEGCGIRAPSVVARLMGLDSLPTSNFQEPYSSPYFGTQSLQDAHYHKKNFEYYHDHQMMYSGDMLRKVESQNSRHFVESKPKKTLSSPFEKFQTEVLPPKSAKSIPVTHHKLLSPIKSPGFVSSNNVAHIMEAAAKIIEPGPQATAKAKVPLVGSSSIPLKVQALKEKVEASQKIPLMGSSLATLKVQDLKQKVAASHRLSEASQRPVESNAAKYLKGQSLNKSWNGSVDTSLRMSPEKEEGSSRLKNKGKSISLAIQAKVNVQRREGLNLSSSRSEVTQRQQSELKSSPTFQSQQNTQKNLPKKPFMQNSSGVLRQNNQKQNCLIDNDNSFSKPLVSNSQGRKLLSRDSSSGRQKSLNRSSGNSKVGSRKSSLRVDGEKELPYSSSRNVPRKKRSIDRDLHFNKTQSDDQSLNAKNQKPVKSIPVIDGCHNWAVDSRRKGMDVVSFTFTAPLTRSLPGSEISGQAGQRKNGFSMDHQGKRMLLDSDGMKLSSLGCNVIGGDALSMLLEEKLRELTFGLESSSRDSVKGGSASSSGSHLENIIPTPRINEQKDQQFLFKDRFGGQFDFEFSTNHPPTSSLKQKLQGVNEMDEYSSSTHLEARKLHNGRHPSPVSILEPSFSNESCDSSITTDSNSTEGSKLCSSVQAQEVSGLSFLKKFHPLEADTDLSDSASSTSTSTLARKPATTLIKTDLSTTEWELEHVKKILCTAELMFKDFALGHSRDIINPHLFNLLESRKGSLESDSSESRVRRKVLFDCVGECLDLRYRSCVGGGFRMWAKGVAMVRRKEWLAEEVYKEISGWESLGDSMVDELVDKDMSSQYGRWLNFEVDEFELAVEVEAQIFDSLIEEMHSDMVQF
ncbi:GPI-anchored adhesin-like protein [Parasponia andersonii]|uniref:GPI-anchored adhesin-like protein n=1 Tax=Parasponia andersonii TaxID=3476 RepID=A0A2P5CLU9_PARAD|nr:GPI-anchored adhesin-like protein [Parasponia andersonii]